MTPRGLLVTTAAILVALMATLHLRLGAAERAATVEDESLRREIGELRRKVEEMDLRMKAGEQRMDRLEETTKGLRQDVDEIKMKLRKRGKLKDKEAA